jgi:ADP-heptose:LPS heptosyltransferase
MLKILVSWLRWRARRARKSTFLPAGVRTLVAVELTRLGDFVTILPALRALRSRFPAARTFVVTSEAHAPLLELCEPGIDVICVRKPKTLIGFLSVLRMVRRMSPDLVCSMGPANRNAALSLASGAPFIVGYLNGTDSLTPFLGVTPVESIGFSGGTNVAFAGENIHDRPWKVLQSIGVSIPRDPLVNFPRWKPDDRRVARHRLLGLKGRYVVMHPFSGWEFRSWPLTQFRSLAMKILGQLPYDVVFLCSDREADQLQPLQNAFRGTEQIVFVPSSDILDSAALIQRADLFVGNDSGPLHLAALLGVPVVGLFGPALPGHTAPYAARGVFIYRKVSCSPCAQTHCIIPTNSCMNRITVEEVYDAANGLLGEARDYPVASHG